MDTPATPQKRPYSDLTPEQEETMAAAAQRALERFYAHPAMKALLLASLVGISPAQADETKYVMPRIPSEAEKIEALKLGYILNGFSMVRYGSSIDLNIPDWRRPEDAGPLPPRSTPERKRK